MKAVTKHFIVAFCFVIISSFMLYGVSRLNTVLSYSICFDSPVSAEIKKSVSIYCQNNLVGKNLSSFDGMHFKNEFPFVQSVMISSLCLHKSSIRVSLSEPLFQANTDTIVLQNGLLVPRSFFLHCDSLKLHKIAIKNVKPDYSVVDKTLLRWFRTTPSDLLAMHDVFWINDYSIFLQDKGNPNFGIMSDSGHPVGGAVQNYCQKIKQNLFEKGSLKSKETCWIADLRFSNQIVVSSRKIRGSYEGGSFFG